MVEVIKLILTQFTDEAVVISSLILFFFFTSIILYWLCSKKSVKGSPYKIPANVVGNYMENAISNTEASNSFLAAGGNPSVVSPGNLKGGAGIGGISAEEFNQKLAEIASLKHNVVDLQGLVKDFEKRLSSQQPKGGGFSIAQAMRDKINNMVKGSSKGSDKKLESKLIKANKQNEKYKKRLKEYEVISDDIADLEKVKKENETLKKSLKNKTEDPQLTIVKEPPKEEEEVIRIKGGNNNQLQEFPEKEKEVIKGDTEESELKMSQNAAVDEVEQPVSEKADAADPPPEGPPDDGEQKSTEDLLSEFEKMLG